MLDADTLAYVAQFFAGLALALVLELGFRRRYEPGYTWVVVIVGTAMVGTLVALRLRLAPVPDLPPWGVVWWQWWLWVNSFTAAGLPVVAWQIILHQRRVHQLIDFMARWHERAG